MGWLCQIPAVVLAYVAVIFLSPAAGLAWRGPGPFGVVVWTVRVLFCDICRV